MSSETIHDDVIKWKRFPHYWPFVRGIHRSPVNSPHKDQRRRAVMFSLIYIRKKRLRKQSWGCWIDTPSRPLWRHCIDKFYLPRSQSNGSGQTISVLLTWCQNFWWACFWQWVTYLLTTSFSKMASILVTWKECFHLNPFTSARSARSAKRSNQHACRSSDRLNISPW